MPEPSNHLLIRAARGEKVERTPVWAMRQAGRWDPAFQAIRSGMGFYEFSESVEKSVQASLCPRRFGVDAIILFYDITTLPVSMGLPFTLQKDVGPVPNHPIRTPLDLARLNANPKPSSYSHIRELLTRVKTEVGHELPVIVFAGAPFTVASYCIGTGKNLSATREFAAEHPFLWKSLLHKLQTATIGFVNQLIDDGADLYQLFDSWAGMLTESEYQEWAQPFHTELFQHANKVPKILFVKECPHIEMMTQTKPNVLSLGESHSLSELHVRYPELVFQGNVSEKVMRTGTTIDVSNSVIKCLSETSGTRHILNLSHGVGKETPVANFETYIRTAKNYVRSQG